MTLMTDIQHISLAEPLPGFPQRIEWTLTPIDADGVLFSLRSADDPGLRFVLTPAPIFVPDYDCGFAAAVAAGLGGADVDVLLILHVGESLQTATANLRAPVVVSRSTGRAVQVVLDDPTLSMRSPLVAGAA
jgi:flagellar assembly factor FliW